jgi:hypothetical protein
LAAGAAKLARLGATMADIHIYTAGSEPRVYPEEGIADLLKSGELTPETFFWREGMAEWEPLAKFQVTPPPAPQHESIVPPRRTEPLPDVSARLAAEPEPAPVVAAQELTSRHVTGRVRFRLRKSPEPLTTIVQVLLILCICVAALELANAFVHYASMSSAAAPLLSPQDGGPSTASDGSSTGPDGTPIVPDDADDTGWMLEYAGWIVNALLIVPYFMWLYRANQNCRHFSHIMHFKPKWAVGCHFVPPMNVFRPCQVVQEIWRVSTNPRTWHNDRRSVLVGIWWGLTLATIALAIFNFVQSLEAASHDDQVQVAIVFIVLKAIQLAWYGTFIAMVSMIVQKQLRVVKNSKNKIGELEEEE